MFNATDGASVRSTNLTGSPPNKTGSDATVIDGGALDYAGYTVSFGVSFYRRGLFHWAMDG